MDDSRVPITITPASLIFPKVPPGFSCPWAMLANKQMNNAGIAGNAGNGVGRRRVASLGSIVGFTDKRVRAVLKNKGQCDFMGVDAPKIGMIGDG
jgi:hypothetical protein